MKNKIISVIDKHIKIYQTGIEDSIEDKPFDWESDVEEYKICKQTLINVKKEILEVINSKCAL